MQLPLAFYFTDDQRGADPLEVARRLPAGCGIIFRHYTSEDRTEIASMLAKICRKRNLTLIIAKNPTVAAITKSAGCHIPDSMIPAIPRLKARFPKLLFTAACHSERSLLSAAKNGADAAFLSPIFLTQSHPGEKNMGAARAALIKNKMSLPVYGLGGVDRQGWKHLCSYGFRGFGAISAFEEKDFSASDLIPRR